MSDVIVDSSVVVKWLLPESDSADAVRVRTDVLAGGGRLIVLDLILPSVGNAIWKAHRQKKISLAFARQALVHRLRSVDG
ncbi:MAG: type II toxin-antitoxin system VapC family toxin [Planctomycetes bacterium]|nr:type II toxin-antitoxin system VapC family toxin [Planctomycetota bacterium]